MEPIDIDKIFEMFLKKYMKANAGKYNEEEWESKMSQLYINFGKTPLDILGMSPVDYYNKLNGTELKDLLKEHLEKKVAIPDFLCDAIINKKCDDEIITLLNTENEELKAYAVNLLNDMGSTKPLMSYFDVLKDDKINTDIKELITEILSDNAETIKEKAIKEYTESPSIKSYIVEILSKCKSDERIYKILIDEFLKNLDNIPLYSSYLSIYGDERALPFLYTEIERDGINYVDFQELKFAIEALGGEYEKERDFSGDILYKKIKEE